MTATQPVHRLSRRVGLAAAGLGGVLVIGTLGFAIWLSLTFANIEKKIYKPLPPSPTRVVAVALRTPSSVAPAAANPTATTLVVADLPTGRMNILLLGTDKRPNDPDHYARSDTLILLNVDPANKKVRALTIPRDLVAEVPGYGVNKINSAYMFGEYYKELGGGQALAVRTVSQLFNLPIDYYATINFDGFRKLVDTVGGVDIDVPYSIDDYNYPSDDLGDTFGELHVHFDAGLQHMNGQTALRYARTRHADNDFARSRRQLQVILAVRQSATRLDLVPKIPQLLDQLGGMIETNIPLHEQIGLAQLAYTLKPSDIITASIDSSLISPVTLDDGSEGLKLDDAAARPLLSAFFGSDWSGAISDLAPAPEATAASQRETPSSLAADKVKPTRTPTPLKRTRRATAVPAP